MIYSGEFWIFGVWSLDKDIDTYTLYNVEYTFVGLIIGYGFFFSAAAVQVDSIDTVKGFEQVVTRPAKGGIV